MRKTDKRVFEKACVKIETLLENGKFNDKYKSHRQAVGCLIGYNHFDPKRADDLLERVKHFNLKRKSQ